ncbi:helix-turn-helix domain-containing protein [Nocardiopsis chromatogenes]|uniref:helix-turn-helix domain-containing protein n=1 Tax=Nocardiopsis chromatogenes TaxID=280239 RepID=UPI000A0619F1
MPGKRLTIAEREEIAILLAQGEEDSRIAELLGRDRTTIWREKRRNLSPSPRAYPARIQATARARRPRARKLQANPELRAQVAADLAQGWSPQQVAGRPADTDQPGMRISHETIYQALYVQAKGGLHERSTRARRVGNVPLSAPPRGRTSPRGRATGRVRGGGRAVHDPGAPPGAAFRAYRARMGASAVLRGGIDNRPAISWRFRHAGRPRGARGAQRAVPERGTGRRHPRDRHEGFLMACSGGTHPHTGGFPVVRTRTTGTTDDRETYTSCPLPPSPSSPPPGAPP